jgi:hypothetical protein
VRFSSRPQFLLSVPAKTHISAWSEIAKLQKQVLRFRIDFDGKRNVSANSPQEILAIFIICTFWPVFAQNYFSL